MEKRNLAKYVVEHRRLPDIDWFMLAAFTAIAGAGGLSNTMFSNYTREKGWGMGARVGAIPSASRRPYDHACRTWAACF